MEDVREFKKRIRNAIADYMRSEGCSCCQGSDHDKHKERIAKLLRVPKYPDGSGYDFTKYDSKTLNKEV